MLLLQNLNVLLCINAAITEFQMMAARGSGINPSQSPASGLSADKILRGPFFYLFHETDRAHALFKMRTWSCTCMNANTHLFDGLIQTREVNQRSGVDRLDPRCDDQENRDAG